MILAASLKRLICRVLIGLLLWSHFAVAAYACPELHGGSPAARSTCDGVAPADERVPKHHAQIASGGEGFASMDPALPNLCVEHCKYGEQKAEQANAPLVAPALLTLLYALPDAEGLARSRGALFQAARAAPSDPPHAILHCCMRD